MLLCVLFRYYSERGDAVAKASKQPHVVGGFSLNCLLYIFFVVRMYHICIYFPVAVTKIYGLINKVPLGFRCGVKSISE